MAPDVHPGCLRAGEDMYGMYDAQNFAQQHAAELGMQVSRPSLKPSSASQSLQWFDQSALVQLTNKEHALVYRQAFAWNNKNHWSGLQTGSP